MKSIISLFALLGVCAPAVAGDLKDDAQRIVGGWQLEFTTPDAQEHQPVVLVGRQKDRLLAWFIEDEKVQEFSSVKLVGEALELGATITKDGEKIDVALTGRMSGEQDCSGTGTFKTAGGDSGSWEFTGQRIGLDQFDETRAFKLDFTTPEGEQRTPTVLLMKQGEQLHAWYHSDDYDLPMWVKKKGDKFSLELEVTTEDGDEVKVVFTPAEHSGDRVSGSVEVDLAGQKMTLEFTGEKVEVAELK